MSPPPTPFHLLRTHHSPLSSLAFNPSNTCLYAGDQDGFVSVTDLRARRVIAYWKAHENGVLGVGEWDRRLISHGRDNVIHIYEPIVHRRGLSLAVGPSPITKPPEIWKTLPTNSLNFCRFALLPIPAGRGKEREALLAVPNLLDSELADVYHLPSMKRLHAAINTSESISSGATISTDLEGMRSGLMMSLHLGFLATTGRDELSRLGLAIGFEDGRVELWVCTSAGSSEENESWRLFSDGRGAVGPRRWGILGRGKGHNEAVMAMTATTDLRTAWTVSADHQLCRYSFPPSPSAPPSTVPESSVISRFSTKQIGNASLALSPDQRVLAVGGWDGKIRLFSAASGKSLGTLDYHRGTVHALAFPHGCGLVDNSSQAPEGQAAGGEEPGTEMQTLEIRDEGESDEEGAVRGALPVYRWLASSGKDRRIALWALMDFGGTADG